ncbi:peptidyl-prolyl cis-trans isomerase [Blattabacterium cuenoti]|uniref:peptidyl-prolyl cis-trans isomerase n=1 Tax=Blattabacterium cuenoti TaxID=1653831 RepID=UPI00163D02FE|nr:peptidyl-prolyl cis-trans isomerase [Blattabacterium cuenoti]
MIKNNFFKSFILFFCFLFFYSYSSLLALSISKSQKIDGIVAIVGDEIILESDIKDSGYSIKDFCENLSKNKLNDLIIKKLILFHSKKNNIKIDNEEIKESIRSFLNKEVGKLDDYNRNKFLKNIKDDKNLFLDKLISFEKDKQSIYKMIDKITNNVEVSPDEIKSFFYDLNKDKIAVFPKKLLISYIIIYPKGNNVLRKKTLNYLNKIKKEMNINPSFNNKKLNIKKLKIEEIPEEFKIIFSLKEKEISDPFETNDGFHIIKLESMKYNEVYIKDFFLEKKYSKNELKNAEKITDSIINKIKHKYNNNINFINKEISTKNNIFFNENILVDENTILKYFGNSFLKLNKNDISKIFKGKINNYFFVIKLLDFFDERPISLEKDYKYIENIVKYLNNKNKVKNWINNVIEDTYIKCT